MFSRGGLLPGGDSYTDCRLRTTDGGEFRAHRGLLCASSPYFRALFSEEHGSPRDVFVSGVEDSALNVLLTFLYTDQLFVSGENVVDVLKAADMLLLDEPRDQCLELLLQSMTPETCLSLATLTRRYSCSKFSEAVMAYVRENFDQAWRCSDDFLDTPAWLLYDLLSSPNLNLGREEDALEVIARWHTAARSDVGSRLPELLRCVRIGCCEAGPIDLFRERWPALAAGADFQEEIDKALELGPCECSLNPLLVKLREREKPAQIAPPPNLLPNPAAGNAPNLDAAGGAFLAFNAVAAAAAALVEAATAAADAASPPESADSSAAAPMPLEQARCNICGLGNPERWLPRVPTELIFVVGGWSKGQAQSTVEAFDNRADRWFQFKTDGFEPRAYHGLVQWRRRLYVVGGIKRLSYLRSVDSFDLDSCEWNQHSPMFVARAYVAVAGLGNHVYAIGGHTGTERTRTVERYEPLTNQWSMVASLSRRRSDGSACAFRERVPPPGAIVAHAGRLFISGGYSGSQVLATVEVYTPSTDSWSLVQSLPRPRCSHRMVEHCGRLYVIGGFDGQRRLDQVLRSEENLPLRWKKMPSLNIPRSTFAVAQLGDNLYVIGGFNECGDGVMVEHPAAWKRCVVGVLASGSSQPDKKVTSPSYAEKIGAESGSRARTTHDFVDSEGLDDFAGVELAYAAYRSLSYGKRYRGLPGVGLTAEQTFFVSHCLKWCCSDNGTQRSPTESYWHSRSRCIVPLQNMPEFVKAFYCRQGDLMNPERRCRFW